MRIQEFQTWLNTTLLAREISPMEHTPLSKETDKYLYNKTGDSAAGFKTGLLKSGFIWQVSQNKARKQEKVCWGGARHILEHQLGFYYDDVKKGVYIDKFDDPENVAFRNDTYLPKCREINRRAYRYVPLHWRDTCDIEAIKIHPAQCHLDAKGALIRA